MRAVDDAQGRRSLGDAILSPDRLAVRLPNHLGDACMALPALQLLGQRCPLPLALVGQAWAPALFEAHGWQVIGLRGAKGDQRQLLRASFTPGTSMVLLTNSFSTALDARLAKLKPDGYATDGRGVLLHRAVPVGPHAELHMVAYYHALVAELTGVSPPVPESLELRLGAAAHSRAHDLLCAAGVRERYVVLCPVAIGLHHGKVKAWDGFGRLAAELRAAGHAVVAMPGPKETATVRAAVPDALVLPESDVATFAAVLAGAALVVANDSGAGHVAAAVGAPLVSVFGVTDPTRTRPWSTRARLLGSADGWPRYEDVADAVRKVLAGS
jgi:heptosyltransferase-2